jgi:hypothetical protein
MGLKQVKESGRFFFFPSIPSIVVPNDDPEDLDG